MSPPSRKPPATNLAPERYAYAYGVKIDESKVPQGFRNLVKYAKYWSVGDDVERAKLLASTPLPEKKELVDAVWPQWQELSDWCDAHHSGGPIPDEVVIFEMLFTAVAEARNDVYPEQACKKDPNPSVSKSAVLALAANLREQLTVMGELAKAVSELETARSQGRITPVNLNAHHTSEPSVSGTPRKRRSSTRAARHRGKRRPPYP